MRMRKKKIIILILGFFFASLILSVTSVFAEEEIYTTADADADVLEDNPTSNYGYLQFLHVRSSGYISEAQAYLHFSFTDKPDNWNKAEIDISIQSTTIPFYVTVYLITAVWDEYTLTWNNKPSHGVNITSITIYSTTDLFFDISEYIIGDGISICVTTSNTQIGTLTAFSREWSSNQPQLIWTYTPNDNNGEIINGYNILLLMLSLIGIVFIIYRKQKARTRI